MAAATRGLPVVALGAGHVEHDERDARERDLGERLLHQREPLTGGAGGARRAGGGRAPRHAHRLELALGVHAHAADARAACVAMCSSTSVNGVIG